MKTKDRILQAALQLFNVEGVGSVSIRDIARVLDMSHGNLQYHFKNTDEMILALYREVARQFDAMIQALDTQTTTPNVRMLTRQTFQLIYAYRFLFMNFVEITRRIPTLYEDYQLLTLRRKTQFFQIFAQLKSNGLIRADIPDAMLQNLVQELIIVGDFWLSNNAISARREELDAVAYYSDVFVNVLYPYLSAAGLAVVFGENRGLE